MSAPVSTLSIDANPLAVRDIGPWLRALLTATTPTEAETLVARLELAVHEVCMNVVDHAGLPPGAALGLRGAVTADRVRIEIHDDGSPFDPSGVPEPVPGVAQVRGYGLMIVRQLVDTVDYRRTEGHNTWVLELHRTPQTGAAATPP
ncbi:ATP-binding protein [Nakamurella deserti]|uniref:ATP-binding protein n=1 Tax=Nakamurella deserti TaxID=2164074 RepID=UPI001300AB0F|nr:ATP-binding protein [Nakamurella deserti]